jgi:hypothetical protein
MHTIVRLTALALMLVACGGAVADSQWDTSESTDSSDAVVAPDPTPAAEPVAPAPAPAPVVEPVAPAPSPTTRGDEPPAPSDPVNVEDTRRGYVDTGIAPEPAPSPNGDDEPAPAAEPEAQPEPTPAVEPELSAIGEWCRDDTQCASDHCDYVSKMVMGSYYLTNERQCFAARE